MQALPSVPKSNEQYELIHNIPHKVGRFGYVFMFLKGEWIKSSKTKKEMDTLIALSRRAYKQNKGSKHA